MKEARFQTAANLQETISQQRMAGLVSKVLGRPLHQAQWSDYERGESEPPLDVIQAAAKVSELPPEYIAFGTKTVAPPLVGDVPGLQLHDATQEAADADRGRKETAKGKSGRRR